MYNMHMLDKIIIQMSRNVQILIRETNIYMKMDAEHNETNPTIQFHLVHEDFEIHITYISKKRIVESSSGNVKNALKQTLRAMKLLPRSHSLEFMNILRSNFISFMKILTYTSHIYQKKSHRISNSGNVYIH